MDVSGIIDYTQTKSSTSLAADAQTQQCFIDEDTSVDIREAADSSRVNEDEQDDEMSESTRITSAEKRKEIHMDESTKELRTLLRHMQVHRDLMTKHQDSLLDLQKNPEPQRQELMRFKMFLLCFKKGIMSIKGMNFFN